MAPRSLFCSACLTAAFCGAVACREEKVSDVVVQKMASQQLESKTQLAQFITNGMSERVLLDRFGRPVLRRKIYDGRYYMIFDYLRVPMTNNVSVSGFSVVVDSGFVVKWEPIMTEVVPDGGR